MKTEVPIIIVALVLALSGMQSANAQGCCTPGTSALSGAERGLTAPRTLKAALSYQYNSLDRAYQGNTPVEDVLQRTATVATVNLDLEYGLSDRVSVLAIVSVRTKRRRFSTSSAIGNLTETTEYRATGLGDVTLLGKYQIVRPSFLFPYEIAVGGGAKLPVGSYTQKNNDVRLAIDLQPGTGAADLLGWFFVSRSFLKHHTTLSASLLYRYAGANPDGYKFGNEWLPTLALQYDPATWLGLSLLARGRIANKDFAEGRFLPSTGGQTYFIMPTIIYREGRLAIRAYKQIPIYRNLIGTQLGLTDVFGVELQFWFQLGGSKVTKIPNIFKTQ